ncbi:MAG: CinA family nicotinamide mononucleotide deamidase-related protein [Candidatus Krumholzibacteria bacterium]|nr:CinA family nicotinamide mononucleotide deamidase-related protein [Candidatus Krumholzibacteria bacterium]
MRVEIITVGDEVLRGETTENNTVWLSIALTAAGLPPSRQTSLPDDIGVIRDELSSAAARSGAVIVTGGLGPTVDDVTRQAAIDAFGGGIEVRDEIVIEIERRFRELGFTMPDGYRDLARIPAGAEVLDNIVGAAPGLAIDAGECLIFLLPGVPGEMKEIFSRLILPRLSTGEEDQRKVLRVYGLMETTVEERIATLLDADELERLSIISSPTGISVYLPAGIDTGTVERAKEILGDDLFGEGSDRLEEVVVGMLRERGLTLVTAESLTGGMLASMIVSVPGASETFLEGYVTYSNESKIRILGVEKNAIETDGAVSEEVCGQMAEGAVRISGADIALSTTGIAGPGGATPGKSVGLCWMGLSHAGVTECRKRKMGGDRGMIRLRTAGVCLDMLRRRLLTENR